MQLSWKPGYSLSNRPVRRSAARRINRGRLGNADGPQQFVFVAEHPMRDLNVSEEASLSVETPFEVSGDASPISAADSPGPETDPRTAELQPHRDNSKDQGQSPCSSTPTDDGQLQLADGDAFYDWSSQVATTIESSPMAASDLPNTTTSMPPSVLYNNIWQRFGPILERYNMEFCTIPLTFDLQMNPFRYRKTNVPEPMFLVHAVMALAGHHVKSPSTDDHHYTALKLLRESINASGNVEDGSSMLDAIMILFSFDETQSTLGYWSTHLKGAYGLIEACGGIEAWTTSARADAQIGLLLWWDAITSLLSRENCVFPYAYVEAILSNPDDRKWNFFDLCGCPHSVVTLLMQVVRLSAEKRQSSSMRYVTFDTTTVAQIEQALESWHHISPAALAFGSEEDIQKDQDCMHCSEAWRHGLLLYIYRVFRWKPGSPIPTHVVRWARVVVDHVVACRDESMVARQALLPLFFAGCEQRDRSIRQKIVQFCSVWNDRTRYQMFGSTIPLLEEVWAEQEAKGFENVWWGHVVDRKHTVSCYPLQMRLCFG
ncbi:fungal-specific transcription factor domain-domain-containing protein [Aspergillus welwitschiae]|uniref:Fungal-specific transcription factor domain-domain-containing protein n=1 Tax=Aspergillus welwitschiae TaxID=1341132 RepID=A0A3F3PLC2_9EURO|nr:fungal-specific transcription factor domain-domain-containing protein [Aspergillus welwitschiae]RDH27735.1 fungal-specific transcription factor domain-domain-containing protein [Aspergillus welwitschiae]